MRRIYDIFKEARAVREYMFGNGDKEKAEENVEYLCRKYGDIKTLSFLEGYVDCVESVLVL